MKKIMPFLFICTALIVVGCNKPNNKPLSGNELNLSVEQLRIQFGDGEETIIEDSSVINDINKMISSSEYMPTSTTAGVGQAFTITWHNKLNYSSSGYLMSDAQLYQLMDTEVATDIIDYIQSNRF